MNAAWERLRSILLWIVAGPVFVACVSLVLLMAMVYRGPALETVLKGSSRMILMAPPWPGEFTKRLANPPGQMTTDQIPRALAHTFANTPAQAGKSLAVLRSMRRTHWLRVRHSTRYRAARIEYTQMGLTCMELMMVVVWATSLRPMRLARVESWKAMILWVSSDGIIR